MILSVRFGVTTWHAIVADSYTFVRGEHLLRDRKLKAAQCVLAFTAMTMHSPSGISDLRAWELLLVNCNRDYLLDISQKRASPSHGIHLVGR
jgi:hypothetical protein